MLASDGELFANGFQLDGLSSIYRKEGIVGLYRGTSLALFGVSNGAIQFMAYEEMKRWGFERKRGQFALAGKEYTPGDDKLVSISVALLHKRIV